MAAKQITDLTERVEKLEASLKEVSETLHKYMTSKSVKTVRTKQPIKGSATTNVVIDPKKTDSTKSSAAASSSSNSPKKPPNIRAWTINKWSEGLRSSIMEILKITDEGLKTKFKTEYEDSKYTKKNDKAKLRAEGTWVYKEYIQNSSDNKTSITEFREKVDKGEYSDNKVEENSTEE